MCHSFSNCFFPFLTAALFRPNGLCFPFLFPLFANITAQHFPVLWP
jgi:hypothetical protein